MSFGTLKVDLVSIYTIKTCYTLQMGISVNAVSQEARTLIVALSLVEERVLYINLDTRTHIIET